MRSLMLATFLALAPAAARAASDPTCVETAPLTRMLEYDSVKVDGDRHILFRLCAPRAQAVRLSSSDLPMVPIGLDGKAAGLPMAKDAQGYWAVRIDAPVKPGPYRFAFNVDGVDMADPQGTQFTEHFRGVRSVVDVSGEEAAFQAWSPNVPHGLVSTINYQSSALGLMRRAHVYTPPGYEGAGGKRYPVLYLVHGAGDSDDSWTSIGHAHLILDNLIASGKGKPMIVVMPFGHTPAREGVDRMRNIDFGADLVDTLIPYVDGHFRTLKGATHRAMAGLSMGGAHTIHFGLTRPDLFGPIGIFSIGLTQGAQVDAYRAAHDAVLKARAKVNAPVFYGFGRSDFLYAMSAPTRKLMDDYHISYIYRESSGGHDWLNWRDYLYEFAPLLFR